MGCASSVLSENSQQSMQIVPKSTHRILLLGTGEAGKSTIIKQIVIQRKHGFDMYVRDEWKEKIQAKMTATLRSFINEIGVNSLRNVYSKIDDFVSFTNEDKLNAEDILTMVKEVWSLQVSEILV